MDIKNFKLIDKGCLKSSFTVVIPEWGNMEVDCLYFEKSNSAFWINYAQKEYTTPDGKKKSWNQVRWPQVILERLNKAIREKIKMLCTQNPQEDHTQEECPF